MSHVLGKPFLTCSVESKADKTQLFSLNQLNYNANKVVHRLMDVKMIVSEKEKTEWLRK
jgi:hypothetical protein